MDTVLIKELVEEIEEIEARLDGLKARIEVLASSPAEENGRKPRTMADLYGIFKHLGPVSDADIEAARYKIDPIMRTELEDK